LGRSNKARIKIISIDSVARDPLGVNDARGEPFSAARLGCEYRHPLLAEFTSLATPIEIKIKKSGKKNNKAGGVVKRGGWPADDVLLLQPAKMAGAA